MRPVLLKYLFPVVLFVAFCSPRATATHIYGADFFYTHVSGNTYTITLIVYGDCSGGAFSNLATSTPEVQIYNGTSMTQTISLGLPDPQGGTEVTPVCAAQVNNTTCVNPSGTIPGVKQFVYSANVNLGGTSANWLFRFTGAMLNNSSAGRSSVLTNVDQTATPNNSEVMVLEATLNNVNAPNSSPTYTTIPTPFFCVNKPSNYNPGTVDPNSDALSYALVAGLKPGPSATSPPGNLTYVTGYSPSAPLAVATGTFSFSNATGQLSFTPNAVQRSLVVNKVYEYRNNVLVGTSMREMTFVILSNCNNTAPVGNISNPVNATVVNSSTVTVCRSLGPVSFKINPTDADGNTINLSATGLPTGASFNVTGNNTTAPSGTFSWNVSGVAPGTYSFFITYTDNGCPLSSRETQAYTVIVEQDPTASLTILTPATCTQKAEFQLTHTTSPATWKVYYYQGINIIDSASSNLTTLVDSLWPGSYIMRVYNSKGCYGNTPISIAPPVITTKANIVVDKPTCNKFADGSITVSGYNSTAPYQYAIGTGSFSNSGTFTGLAAGQLLIHIKDADGCVKDTLFTLLDSLTIVSAMTVANVKCNGEANGSISIVASGGHGAYTYSIDNGPLGSNNIFQPLAPTTYIIRAEDSKGCWFDTSIVITDPPVLVPSHSFVDVDCYGNATGSITMTATGGVTPYEFNLNGGSYVSSGTFNSLKKGTYIVNIRDFNGCIKTATVTLNEPPELFIGNMGVLNARCYGSSDGVIIVNGGGGKGPYTYSTNGGQYTSGHLQNLPAGTHIVHVKDANGCIIDTTVQLGQPEQLQSTIAGVKRPICTPYGNGSFAVLASGGTIPYSYSIGQDFNPWGMFEWLHSGLYTVTVKDNNGCVSKQDYYLADSIIVSENINLSMPTCFGFANGVINVAPADGTAPYTTALNDTVHRSKFKYEDLPAGTYRLRVRDAIGCIADTTFRMTHPDKLSLDTTVTPNNCYGAANVGSVKVDVIGGTEPYTYTWNIDAEKTNMAANLANGQYFVRVVDAQGCRDSLVAEIVYADCCTPLIPTAFTPNGDGRNDVFRVMSQGDMNVVALSVFNRFGQRVFFAENTNEGWDGTIKGAPAELGTYYYHLKAACGYDGKHIITLKGDVTVIR
jgi:gliding motility-associated-like protein